MEHALVIWVFLLNANHITIQGKEMVNLGNRIVIISFQYTVDSLITDEAMLMRYMYNKVPYSYIKQYYEILS